MDLAQAAAELRQAHALAGRGAEGTVDGQLAQLSFAKRGKA